MKTAFDNKDQVWAELAADLPKDAISWRQDGKTIARDGKFFARFVCYIEAGTVRERLDAVVPGEWDLTMELLPQVRCVDSNGVESIDGDSAVAFKARLQVLGVIREDVGNGKDYKSAATDAFKRAAVRFGIGHELYSYEQNWVQVESDAKYAKPVEDPQAAYDRRHGEASASRAAVETDQPGTNPLTDVDAVSCPKCGGRMWDNRLTKRNPKAPDYKCRDRNCDGVIWPEKPQDEPDERPGDEPPHPAEDDGEDFGRTAPRSTPPSASPSARRRPKLSLDDEIPF